jgi:L-asparaginase|tara:strand:- start:138 stop:623 length:486 start_codon:yes stop_codon:yes gene_type:complete
MIQIFITGGTFDKSYNHKNGKLFFKKTHLPEMLKRSKSQLDIDIKTLMMIDSLEMKSNEVQTIIANCKKTQKNKIVITHGTDTMVKTAKAIAKEKIDKTIILTGAMIPYAFGSSSDGFFNLGCALSYVQTLDTGVYITMHGRYFKWNEVIKNSEKGYFVKN